MDGGGGVAKVSAASNKVFTPCCPALSVCPCRSMMVKWVVGESLRHVVG